MGPEKVCRTCLKESSTEEFVEINFKGHRQRTTIGDKLKSCVPEMNISEQEHAEICSQCVDLLESAFVFRTTCLNTEKQLKRISSVYYSDLVKILKQRGVDLSTDISATPSTSRKSCSASTSKRTSNTTSVADSTTIASRTWTITTRRHTYRASEPLMPVLEAQGGQVGEEKKVAQASKSTKKRLSEGQMLQQALKSIPELQSHTVDMLDCRVTVQKLPQTIASALMPNIEQSTPTTTTRTGKKQTQEEAKANKYCFTCKKWFQRPNKLRLHNKMVHLKEDMYTCFHCNRGFATKRLLQSHLRRCPKRPPKLKGTPKKTKDPPNNVSPIQRTMPELERDESPPVLTIKTEPENDGEAPVAVDEMEFPPQLYPIKIEPVEITVDPSTENSLLQNSAEEPIFHCNICGEMFSSEKDMDEHKQVHARCRLCMECFLSEEAKSEHERMHYNTKPGCYYCLVCKVSVTSKDHFNIHTGARPYSCDHCKKSFTSRSTLHGHRFVHMNDKPHQCSICQKGYIKRCDMVKHRATCMLKKQKKETILQKKKPQPQPQSQPQPQPRPQSQPQPQPQAQKLHCSLCGKDFDNNVKMRTHICMNAEGERIFKCHICELVLIGRKDFIVHVKRHFVETETQLDQEVVSK